MFSNFILIHWQTQNYVQFLSTFTKQINVAKINKYFLDFNHS